MKYAGLLLLVIVAMTPWVSADDYKVASFDMRKVFREWEYSIESQKKIEDKRADLEEDNNARLATINSLKMQRTNLQQEYRQNVASMTDEERKKMDLQFRQLGREAMALEQDRRDHYSKNRKGLANEITSEANLILDRVVQEARDYAEEQKFAMVIESGGETTSNTSFFLHVEGMIDITDILIKRLNSSKD